MASRPVIRLAARSAKFSGKYLFLQCHVKPGAAKQREGVVAVSDNLIEVCVSAMALDGQANLAVRKVFSDVYFSWQLLKPRTHCTQIFECPKSDIEITRGLKSREKTIAISGIDIQGDNEECISRIRRQLESAIG